MIEAVMPNGYEIETHYLHTNEDGTEIWKLKYKEFFTEEDYHRAEVASKKQYAVLTNPYEFDDENHTFYSEITGSRDQILCFLAGEFLGVSPFGMMTFKDLLATISVMVMKSGQINTLIGSKQPAKEEVVAK